jgi:mono/diheme cytochrome c family protein
VKEKKLKFFTYCGVFLMVSFIPVPRASAARDAEKPIELGGKLYGEHCASCHGKNLEGQPNWKVAKPDGRLLAPPHDATGHTWHHPDKQLFEITKKGTEAIVGGTYKSDMIGFADVLNDDEIRAVLAYIESTWPEPIRKRRERMRKR